MFRSCLSSGRRASHIQWPMSEKNQHTVRKYLTIWTVSNAALNSLYRKRVFDFMIFRTFLLQWCLFSSIRSIIFIKADMKLSYNVTIITLRTKMFLFDQLHMCRLILLSPYKMERQSLVCVSHTATEGHPEDLGHNHQCFSLWILFYKKYRGNSGN